MMKSAPRASSPVLSLAFAPLGAKLLSIESRPATGCRCRLPANKIFAVRGPLADFHQSFPTSHRSRGRTPMAESREQREREMYFASQPAVENSLLPPSAHVRRMEIFSLICGAACGSACQRKRFIAFLSTQSVVKSQIL
jgi:hypothetical protein